MYCSKCGNQIADGSKFCSFCGSPVEELIKPVVAEPEPVAEPVARRPVFEDIKWDVNEYPDTNGTVAKTEDINFDWGADPSDIKDRYTTGLTGSEAIQVKVNAEAPAPEIPEIPVTPEPAPAEMSAAEKIDRFYTFSKKNEEFQQLLNREYDKIRGGNPIGEEQAVADKTAAEKFETRPQDPSMDAFLEREGVVKLYEPKAFESDVLQRIEAQERAKEEARLEEEAREKALEEARLQAEAEMRAAEEARRQAEEQARLAAEEEARRRAEEDAQIRAAEEARLRAEEEARLAAEEAKRIEEEARLAAEEAKRIEEEERLEAERAAREKAEEEARERAAQEQARLKAEAELKAQREAAKIRAQREARQAAEEEERNRLEIERRRQEEEQLHNRLAEKKQNLQMQADSAVAAEEVRKVLAQTARMREEEAAKIRAAVAGLKNESPEPAVPAQPAPSPIAPEIPEPAEPAVPAQPEPTPIAPEIPEPAEPAFPVEPETPVIPEPAAPAEPVVPAEPIVPAEPVVPEVPAEPEVPAAPVEEISPELEANRKAHAATQEGLSEMAKARREFLKEFGIDPLEPAAAKEEKKAEPVPATVEELLGEKPVTGRETMLSESGDVSDTKVIDKNAILAGMDATIRISKEELKAVEAIDAAEFEAPAKEEPAAPVLETKEPAASVEELLEQFATSAEPEEEKQEEVSDLADIIYDALKEEIPETPAAEGFAVKEEPAIEPDEAASEAVKPGLDNTMFIPGAAIEDGLAEDLKLRQEAEAAVAPAEEAAEAEEPAAEEPAAEEPVEVEEVFEEEDDEEKKGGAGRVILKVLLVILIIIFAVELAGIGIKFLAPNSKAAEVIDNQLNKVIHLITGYEQDYSVPGVDYEV